MKTVVKILKWVFFPVTLLAILIGAYIIVKNRGNRVSNLKSALKVQKNLAKVKQHTEEVGKLIVKGDAHNKKADELVKETIKLKKEVVAIEQGRPLEDMSDQEVADAFSSLDF